MTHRALMTLPSADRFLTFGTERRVTQMTPPQQKPSCPRAKCTPLHPFFPFCSLIISSLIRLRERLWNSSALPPHELLNHTRSSPRSQTQQTLFADRDGFLGTHIPSCRERIGLLCDVDEIWFQLAARSPRNNIRRRVAGLMYDIHFSVSMHFHTSRNVINISKIKGHASRGGCHLRLLSFCSSCLYLTVF